MSPFPANQYNILFVLTDQERYIKEVPSTVKRPGLQKLQERGVTFVNHHINSVACSSSRSNIYTGKHIVQTEIFDNVCFPWQKDLSTKVQTLGHRLRDAGYKTAYKGKWHLTNRYGRDYKEGIKSLSLEEYGFSDWHGIGDGIHHVQGGHQFDSMTVASAVHWLKTKGQSCREEGQPWLLAVNLVNPHDIMFFNTDDDENIVQGKKTMAPIAKAPNHTLYKTKHDILLPENWQQPLEEMGRPKAHGNYSEFYEMMVGCMPACDENRLKRYQDYYFNCIQDMDDNLDRLLKQLDALGMSHNTIVVYTSDHGELGGAHGLRGKGSCAYREQNNVPLVIAHPGYEGGKHCKAITSHIDLVPTMLASNPLSEAIKAKVCKDLPGKDLTKLLENPEDADFDAVRPGSVFTYNMLITNMPPPSYIQKAVDTLPSIPKFDNLRGAVRSINDGHYRFTRYFSPKQHNTPESLEQILKCNDIELFDLQKDPLENINLAQHPEGHRDIIEQMNTKMNALILNEIGEDVGQMLPLAKTLVSWSVKPEAMAGF